MGDDGLGDADCELVVVVVVVEEACAWVVEFDARARGGLDEDVDECAELIRLRRELAEVTEERGVSAGPLRISRKRPKQGVPLSRRPESRHVCVPPAPMIPRQSPLEQPPILFATGGASGHTTPDRHDAYQLALRLGATGVETTLLATADGTPVLRSDARLGGLRRRRVSDVASTDLPDDVVTLDGFYDAFGAIPLLLHVGEPSAVDAAIVSATRHQSLDHLWLASSDAAALDDWRARSSLVRLVDSTPIASLPRGLERHAANLRERRIDALLLPHADWNGGRTAMLHRFGRRCVATGAAHERMIRRALHIGADAVSSGWPDRLVDAAAAVDAPDAPAFLDE